MNQYVVVIEKAGRTYSAYVPDLPGCVAIGESAAAAKSAIRSAISFHIRGMIEDGQTVPKPTTRSTTVRVSGARRRPKRRAAA